MSGTRPVQIVYVSDHRFLKPTALSIWSLLTNLKGQADLHVWGDNLSDADWQGIRRIAAINTNVTLHELDISTGFLEGAHGPVDYIPAATMGRLYIPRDLSGYVLYVDGDTLVTGDVGKLFELDLGDAYAGAVRDYTILHWLADKPDRPDRASRLAEVAGLLSPAPARDYVNAGIMLFNCDQIRQSPDLLEQVQDVVAASNETHGDQDHLNRLFRGRIKHLDVSWNSSWCRERRHKSFFRKLGIPADELSPGNRRIVHYHGPEKPWRIPRRDFWTNRGRATILYRRQLARFAQDFPDLAPS